METLFEFVGALIRGMRILDAYTGESLRKLLDSCFAHTPMTVDRCFDLLWCEPQHIETALCCCQLDDPDRLRGC